MSSIVSYCVTPVQHFLDRTTVTRGLHRYACGGCGVRGVLFPIRMKLCKDVLVGATSDNFLRGLRGPALDKNGPEYRSLLLPKFVHHTMLNQILRRFVYFNVLCDDFTEPINFYAHYYMSIWHQKVLFIEKPEVYVCLYVGYCIFTIIFSTFSQYLNS